MSGVENEIKVVYRQNKVIVAEKPAGVLSEGNPITETIGWLLSRQLGVDTLYPINRLDRVTGGLMLLAEDSTVASKLSAVVASGNLHKSYFAVVEGKPTESRGVLRDILFFDRRVGKTFVVDRERKGAKSAELEYSVVATVLTDLGERTLVKIRLHTGRTHQIRVQFSSRGLSLCGDGKYGGHDKNCRCALWSCGIDFFDPINKRRVSAESLPPDEYPWNLFELQEN